ncbi:MAG: hypothetical protein M1831_006292 [Alyxoria varia]|nr:MAG: hypothetical protein M1831_006292 [Alyxoria varia]
MLTQVWSESDEINWLLQNAYDTNDPGITQMRDHAAISAERLDLLKANEYCPFANGLHKFLWPTFRLLPLEPQKRRYVLRRQEWCIFLRMMPPCVFVQDGTGNISASGLYNVSQSPEDLQKLVSFLYSRFQAYRSLHDGSSQRECERARKEEERKDQRFKPPLNWENEELREDEELIQFEHQIKKWSQEFKEAKYKTEPSNPEDIKPSFQAHRKHPKEKSEEATRFAMQLITDEGDAERKRASSKKKQSTPEKPELSSKAKRRRRQLKLLKDKDPSLTSPATMWLKRADILCSPQTDKKSRCLENRPPLSHACNDPFMPRVPSPLKHELRPEDIPHNDGKARVEQSSDYPYIRSSDHPHQRSNDYLNQGSSESIYQRWKYHEGSPQNTDCRVQSDWMYPKGFILPPE